MIDPADYADLLAALRHDLQLDLATDALPNTFPIVSGLMLGQWVTPTLLNAYTSFSPVGYFKDPLGFVHLRGSVQTGASGAVAFTLPAGYRPGVSDYWPALQAAGVAGAFLHIGTDGTVTPTYTGAQVWLSNITFLAEN